MDLGVHGYVHMTSEVHVLKTKSGAKKYVNYIKITYGTSRNCSDLLGTVETGIVISCSPFERAP
jgi:hypothetical protein